MNDNNTHRNANPLAASRRCDDAFPGRQRPPRRDYDRHTDQRIGVACES